MWSTALAAMLAACFGMDHVTQHPEYHRILIKAQSCA
uniref:Uncharacterized protein n=1 Tax=Anguilla anguilla TaxID=7936 RepID=A0A0E9U5L4_ANGAN